MRNRIEDRAVQQGGRLNRPSPQREEVDLPNQFGALNYPIIHQGIFKYLKLSKTQRLIISLSANRQRVLIDAMETGAIV